MGLVDTGRTNKKHYPFPNRRAIGTTPRHTHYSFWNYIKSYD